MVNDYYLEDKDFFKDGKLEIPNFLLNREISTNDHEILQKFFKNNHIQKFSDISAELLRNSFEDMYMETLNLVKILGLYGVRFLSNTLKSYSAPNSLEYKLLKFPRNSDKIKFKDNCLSNEKAQDIKRYFYNLQLDTYYVLDGIKLDVLLNQLNITEVDLCNLLDFDIYSKKEIDNLYKKEKIDNLNKKSYIFAKIPNIGVLSSHSNRIPSYVANIKFNNEPIDAKLLKLLIKNNIETIGNLLEASITNKINFSDFDKNSLDLLNRILSKYDLELGNEYEIIDDNIDNKIVTEEIPSQKIIKISSEVANRQFIYETDDVRLLNGLMYNNIAKIKDVLVFSENDLLKIPNFGEKSLKELKSILKKYGIFLNSYLEEKYIYVVDDDCILDRIKIPRSILEKKLVYETFDARLLNVIDSEGFETIEDIFQKTENDLLKIPNFGRKTLKEVKRILDKYNLNLGIDDYEVIDDSEEKQDLRKNSLTIIEKFKNGINEFVNSIKSSELDVYNSRISSIEKLSLQEVGEKLHITRERVRQIEKKVRNRLNNIMHDILSLCKCYFDNFGEVFSIELTDLKLISQFFPLLSNMLDDNYCFYDKFNFLSTKNFNNYISNLDFGEKYFFSKEELFLLIKENLRSFIKSETEEQILNFNKIAERILSIIISSRFDYDEKKDDYVLKDRSSHNDILSVVFKELYPNGEYLLKKSKEVYDKIAVRVPYYKTPRSMICRLINHEDIILTNNGFYKHIDTLSYAQDAVDLALSKCREKLKSENSFMINAIYSEDEFYFKANGIESPYMLTSLINRMKPADVHIKKLVVFSDNYITQQEVVENYFLGLDDFISESDAFKHFRVNLGWPDYKSYNFIFASNDIYKFSFGFIHKQNLIYDVEALKQLLNYIEEDILKDNFCILNRIKENYKSIWCNLVKNEILETSDLEILIRDFNPDYEYEIDKDVISIESMSLIDVIVKKIDNYCSKYEEITKREIYDIIRNYALIQDYDYRTFEKIKNYIFEIDDEVYVTKNYIGYTDEKIEKIILEIDEEFKKSSKDFYDIKTEILPKITVTFDNVKINSYLLRSVLEEKGLRFCGLLIINPYKTEFSTRDFIIAKILYNYENKYFMKIDLLDKLLHRENVLLKKENLYQVSIQNEIFGEFSCLNVTQDEISINPAFRGKFNEDI